MRASVPWSGWNGEANREAGLDSGREGEQSAGLLPLREPLRWWYHHFAPPEPPVGAPFAQREAVRRGQLASGLMLCLLVLAPVGFVSGLGDVPTMVIVTAAFVANICAILLNRGGRVNLAGGILVAIVTLSLMGSPLTAPNGHLDMLYVPVFDLLIFPVLITAAILPPLMVFPVALLNALFVVGDVLLQPKSATFQALLNSRGDVSYDVYLIMARPIVLFFVVAVVAFLWARNVGVALRTADRADELAELRAREATRTHELEEGVRQILAVHVQLANGDFSARVPMMRNALLWKVGVSLNNVIGRMGRLAQADFALRRTRDESQRLVEAINAWQEGRPVRWPAPSGTPLDAVIESLRDVSRRMPVDAGAR